MIPVYTIHGPIHRKSFPEVVQLRKCPRPENGSDCIECSRRTNEDVLKWFREETGMSLEQVEARVTVAKEMGNYSQDKTWATSQNLVEWRKQPDTFPVHSHMMKSLFSTINGGETSGGFYERNPLEEAIGQKKLRLEKENKEIKRKAFESIPTLRYRCQSYKSATYAQECLSSFCSGLRALRKAKGWPRFKEHLPSISTHAELKLVIRHIIDGKLQEDGCLHISVSRDVCTTCRLLLFFLAIQGRYQFALLASQRKGEKRKKSGRGNQQPSLHLTQYTWVDGINRKMTSYTQQHVNRALVCETMHLEEISPEQVTD